LSLVLCAVAMFRSAAEAQDGDILKLYNTRGSLISIGPSLPANTPDTRYRLEVVAASIPGISTTMFTTRGMVLLQTDNYCWYTNVVGRSHLFTQLALDSPSDIVKYASCTELHI